MTDGGNWVTLRQIVQLLNRKAFVQAPTIVMKFISMLLFIIVCGNAFGNSLGASGLSMRLVEATQGLGITPVVFVGIILFIYLLFGLVCDAPIILILTLPILAPMLRGMGIDLIWFGVLSVLMTNLGTITPPYAMGIFMLRSIAPPDVSLGTMFRGIVPFCLSSLAVGVLILFFPALATLLPGLMR